MPTGQRASDSTAEELWQRAERVRREELEEALAALESRSDLTQEQRDALEDMSAAIVEAVIAAPAGALEDSPDTDAATVRSVATLFDLRE